MPLINSTSDEARLKNYFAEKQAGKKDPQAWAIAYSTQRAAAGKPRRKKKAA